MLQASGYGAPKFDAAETAFVQKALTYVENQVYETILPPKEGGDYVHFDESTPPGTKTILYRMYTRVGIAQFITDDTDDMPAVSFYVKEIPHEVRTIGGFWRYNYMDLLAAGRAIANGGPPINIDTEMAIAAREGIERKLDRISAIGSTDPGDPDFGMLGLVNQPNASIYTLAVGSAPGATTAWSTKTPDEIIGDFGGIVASQVAATFKAFRPKRIIVPIQQHEVIAMTSMGDGRSDTVLGYWVESQRKSGRPIDVQSWQFCKGAGVGSTDRMIAYDPNPRYVRHMIALRFLALPPTLTRLTYETPAIAQSAGVITPYPVSITYADGL